MTAGWVRVAVLLLIGIPSAARADDAPFGNRDTMWRSEHYIGALRHMGEIYFARPVKRGDTASELPQGEAIDSLTYRHDGKDIPIEDYFSRARSTGLIVLKDGKVVYERYLLAADRNSLFTSWSMAKSFTSTLVGFAIGDGLIKSVDDPIDQYVPGLKGSGFEGVPIKAVLQMSSGVDFVEDYDRPESDINTLWAATIQYNTKPVTEFLSHARPGKPPFSTFNYSGLDTSALGWLVSSVTRKPLADYLSEKLWVPLGMQADANWNLDGDGGGANEIAYCCLNATLRDYARFGQFLLNGGNWNGRQLLPAGWVAEATHPDRPQVMPGKLHEGWTLGYQYQWWVFPDGSDSIGGFTAQGINGQFLYVNPKERLVIIATNAWREFWDDDLEREIYDIFAAFQAKLR
ncbi:serine hydrolase domain-containing protein [Dongia sp.]|uniref:serine hydrolase domain-containing protein n=1 Tax=Dongia sp. TaxID=1977262 RepID=UPI003752F2FB